MTIGKYHAILIKTNMRIIEIRLDFFRNDKRSLKLSKSKAYTKTFKKLVGN